ncbi:Inward rectifier potassium channel 2 [Folsomia candida]|uniref:Inward rectifier potassium channel 2 n=1 Tax=Folsomia candida TaxID=158441 RepID=A0A226CZN3_FOLCA|nr:Inward rectifier potassium channel 2 [Folsomia candida]
MRWTWFKDSAERSVLVPSDAGMRDPSYDSFNDDLSAASHQSLFGFLRRRKVLPQSNTNVRALNKDGTRAFSPVNIHQHRRKFTADIFTTLLELKWRWIFVSCFITYFGSWLFFAALWYLIVFLHGDLDPAVTTLPENEHTPCVTGVIGFASVFLFSVETQHTIGYGAHYVTEECGLGVLLLCFQSIVGVILEGLVVGLVFLKISRPKKRSETLAFSRNAVICHRDGKRYFMFRVADTRTSHLLEAHVRAQVVWKRFTQEGELVTHSQEEITVQGDGEKGDKILLFWPTTVVHEIDKDSPLDPLQPKDFQMENNASFEIVVVLEGVLETTGLMTQARTSYSPHEARIHY